MGKRPSAVDLARQGQADVKKFGGQTRASKHEVEASEGTAANQPDVDKQSSPSSAPSDGQPNASIGPATAPEAQAVPDPKKLVKVVSKGQETAKNLSKKRGTNTETPSGPPTNSKQESMEARLAQYDEEKVYHIPLDDIVISGINARIIDEDDREFHDLVESLRTTEQISPAIVGVDDGQFQLIAGERRFRALRVLGRKTIKAIITSAPREEWETIMLLENLQRQDLNAFEEARGYQMLLDRGWTQKRIAAKVGKTKGHISTVLSIARNSEVCAALDERKIPSISFAREFDPLLDADGEEIMDGVIGEAIEYLEDKNPTVVRFRSWVQARVAGVVNARRKRQPRRTGQRPTFIVNEEKHLASVYEQAKRASVLEREWLANLFEQQATRLRGMGESEESDKLKE